MTDGRTLQNLEEIRSDIYFTTEFYAEAEVTRQGIIKLDDN